LLYFVRRDNRLSGVFVRFRAPLQRSVGFGWGHHS
jgi:hypothetical protein